MLTKLQFAPGINRDDTRYASGGGYFDCDRMRFRRGYPESIGGWAKYSPGDFLGSCTFMFPYSCACGADLMPVGTHLKFYVESGLNFYDITPIQHTSTLASDAFTTDTNTPTILTINDVTNEALEGGFVIISGVTGPINGVPESEINGEHRVLSSTPTEFTIAITTAPSFSGTTGAATVEYQLSPGLPIFTAGSGWGAGTWGRSTWGSGFGLVAVDQLRLWNGYNYGDAFIFGPRGGKLYYWLYTDPSSFADRAEAIEDLPSANEVPLMQNIVTVSDQRFVICFGTNDFGGTEQIPMLVRWSDQENFLEWEPTATTQAGSQILTNGSEIITARNSRQEILIWTDTALYAMQYQGPPFVYGFTLLGDNMSIMGPNATIVLNGVSYWMGRDKFYTYDGAVRSLPSSVRNYVFNDFNFSQSWQVVAGGNEQFNEVWWLYPSKNALLNDRYVVYNYQENIWYYGTLERTFWLDSAQKPGPLATQYNPDTELSFIYEHEFGYNDGSVVPEAALNSFIETSDFDLADGDQFSFVKRILPDLTFEGSTNKQSGNVNAPIVNMTVRPRRSPGSNYQNEPSNEVRREAVVPIEQFTEQVFVRARGRQMALRFDCPSRGTKWRMGVPRIDIQPDGKK